MSELLIKKIENNMHMFTAKQKLVAVAILQDPMAASFYSVKEFAKKAGVSPSSVVRFAQQITDGGFPQLQTELYDYVQTISNPIERLQMNVSPESEDDALLAKIFETQLENMRKTFNQNLISSAKNAANLIAQASHTYICGSRGSFAPAYYLGHHLNRVLNNVDIVADDSRLSDFLLRLRAEDVVILFGPPRYSGRMLAMANQVKKSGAKLISITDSPQSPFVQCSDISFFVYYQSNDYHNSALAPMLVSEVLISIIISRNLNRALDNLDAIEPIFDKLNQFTFSGRSLDTPKNAHEHG